MSYPPPAGQDPNNPYAKQPQQPPQPPQQGYGYPQQQPQGGQPGYGYPQQPQYGQPAQPGGIPGQPGYGYPGGPAAGQQAPEGYTVVPNLGTVQIASYGQRFGARLLDSLFVGLINFAVTALLGFGLFATTSTTTDPGEAAAASFGTILLTWVIFGIVAIFWDVIWVSVSGATPGKMILGLSIVDNRYGMKPGFGGALVRWGFPIGLGILTCWLGYILILISPFFDNTGRLRGWHDKAANTQVIKK